MQSNTTVYRRFLTMATMSLLAAMAVSLETSGHYSGNIAFAAQTSPVTQGVVTAAPCGHADTADKEPGALTGIVRDTEGKPVSGADVWIGHITREGRQMFLVMGRKTASDGTYRFDNIPYVFLNSPPYTGNGTMMLFAITEGHSSALGYVDLNGKTTTAPDLIVPDVSQGTTLTVRVLDSAGVPAANRTVEARPDFANEIPYKLMDFEGRGDLSNSEILTQALRPRAITDWNGIARFSHLIPAVYKIAAPISGNYHGFGSTEPGQEFGTANGVPVQLAGENRFTLRLQKTVVAYFPQQKRIDNVLQVATEKREPGNLKISVLDEIGRPIPRGTVYEGDYSLRSRNTNSQVIYATDKNGQVRLTGHRPGQTTLYAEEETFLPAIPNDSDAFLLTDSQLTHSRRWPAVTVTVPPNAEMPITLRAVPVGWIRGIIKSARGQTIDPTYNTPWELESPWGTRFRFNAKTGEYLYGPLPPGDFALPLYGNNYSKPRKVRVKPGAVTHLDLTLDPVKYDLRQVLAEAKRLATSLKGSVFLPDGRTPATGVRLFIIGQPLSTSYWVDGRGNLNLAPFAYPESSELTRYEGKVYPQTSGQNKPVLATVLPGSYGMRFTAVPPDGKPVRIVLPPAISVSGTVTVGGRSLGPRQPGVIRILAACTNQGRFNDVLSVETTAQPDGSFTLAGLTPNTRYTVQAMLDETWISPGITLKTDNPGKSVLPTLALAIPEPGDPVIIERGKNAAGKKVFLASSPYSGPLSPRVTPVYYVVDGAGKLRIEGLPAGPVRLRLTNGKYSPLPFRHAILKEVWRSRSRKRFCRF